MNILWKLLLCSLSVGLSAGRGLKVFNNVTDVEYYSMPRLFHLDYYDKCVALKSESLYCFATIQLSPLNPNNISKTWNTIEETIELERNYRHDRLRHGICVQEVCPNIPRSLYAVGNGSEELWKGLSDCYSDKYSGEGLKGQVVKLYCENDGKFYEIDLADKIYAVCVISLISLVLIGSLYDSWSKESEKNQKNSNVDNVLRSFSLPRNFQKLLNKSEGEDAAAFAPIQGIRVMSLCLVVMTHTILIQFKNPVQNPEFVEKLTLDAEKVLWSNGGLLVQTFFVISGWLASYMICRTFEKRFSLRHVGLLFVNRMIRLLPVLILTVGFNSTWMRHFGQGPMWQNMIDDEFNNCRNNFLWNLLFVNNYYHRENMCLQQTWYISSEVQSFVVGLFIMYTVLKQPKHAGKIFAFCITSGVAIAFLDHFYHQYDAVFRCYPELMYTTFIDYSTWHDIYSAGHLQFPTYALGLAGGYYFYKKIRVEKKKYEFNYIISKVFLVAVLLTPIAVLESAYFFYQEGFVLNRFTAALYQAVSRIGFAFPMLLIIFVFSIGKGGIFRSFCGLYFWQVLARVTYSVYISHITYLRLSYGTLRSPNYLTNYNLGICVIGDILFTFLVGTVLCLTVELPIGALQKIYLQPKPVQMDREKTQ